MIAFLVASTPSTTTTVPESTTTVVAYVYGSNETWFLSSPFVAGVMVAFVLWLTLILRAEGGET